MAKLEGSTVRTWRLAQALRVWTCAASLGCWLGLALGGLPGEAHGEQPLPAPQRVPLPTNLVPATSTHVPAPTPTSAPTALPVPMGTAAPTSATAPAVVPAPTVAVIDLAEIFKQSLMFQQRTEEFQAEVLQGEQELVLRRATVARLEESLANKNLPEKQRQLLEAELTQAQADLNAFMAAKRAELKRQEAALYHAVYEQIVAEIHAFIAERGIQLVIHRRGHETIDPSDAQAVLRGINNPIVAYLPQVDITQPVLQMHNARYRQRMARQ
jgi:Skp family chaperone for outer membrane proteins